VTPCLLTVRTTRDVFTAHDLKKVDAIACLKHLNAELSPKPHELRAVRPIVSFSMVDPRFVDKPDILAQLDQRPNLALLKPAEFEALITNLFEKMGLETRLTQASRDGGVDCVAWDMREVVGGKVIIQAKRYKNTVGVSAVRDLYGTVLNEGATKGILVTTSGYGTASAVFADKKPLRLIHGGELLYLLEHHTGVKAKIEFPQEWVDPRPDIVEADIPVSTTKPSLDVKSDTSVISIQTDSRPAAGITDRPSETGNSSS
jgi:restriction system protein